MKSNHVLFALAWLAVPMATRPASAADAVKVAAYTALDDSTDAAGIDALARGLGADSTSSIFVFAYGGRHFVPNEARRLGLAARQMLIERAQVDSSRVTLVDGGYRTTREVELWLVPEGADLPLANPTLTASQVLKGWKRRPPPKKK